MSTRIRRVMAVLAALVSPAALMVSAHPAAAAACGTPMAVMASDNGDGNSATVTWTPVGTCSAFAIYAYGYAPASSSGPMVTVHPTSDTIGGLSADGTYVFTVIGFDSVANAWSGWSGWSGFVQIHSAPPPGPNPFGDPNLVSMFDGTDLNGWTSGGTGGPMPAEWSVVNGVLHSNGTGRGWLYYNKAQFGSFRWIFDLQQLPNTGGGGHAPTVLFWGTLNPIRDALSAIQLQPPNGSCWDYRPGHNNGCPGETTSFAHASIPVMNSWAQCEMLGNQATSVVRMACCPLGTATTCKAVEVVDFHSPGAGVVGPLAIQTHNAGLHYEYKNLWVESPVADPAHLITT